MIVFFSDEVFFFVISESLITRFEFVICEDGEEVFGFGLVYVFLENR